MVHGDEAQLSTLLRRRKQLAERCTISHATEVVAMDVKPSVALRQARGSTMWKAVETVAKGKAGSVVSCGNTGALMAMAMGQLRRARRRPAAIAVLWPSLNACGYNVVLDVGAASRPTPHNYAEFAVMGAEYARVSFDETRPRLGLLNVGTETDQGRRRHP